MTVPGCICGTCTICQIRIKTKERNKRSYQRYIEKRAITQSEPKPRKRIAKPKPKPKKRRKHNREPIDFFIDGEGHGRNPHLYTYLAAVSIDGTTYEIRNPAGLSSKEVLCFLTDTLPNRARLWGYALGYDKTKWLQDLPRDKRFLLYNPQFRKTKEGRTRPIMWDDFYLDIQSTKFTIRHIEKGRKKSNWERRTIWDAFRYFQESFVKAIERWGVCTPDELAFIKRMKDERHQFDALSQDEIERYCKLECLLGARLVHALLQAHRDIGLETKVFFGPGSTAECMLIQHNVEAYMQNHPLWAHEAIMTAFSGGRFENRLFGVVEGPLHSYDISSAYPYQSFQLPCLQCGFWTYHEGSLEELLPLIESATLACTHVYVPKHPDSVAYAPFPFRDLKGSICYPFDCETWVWQQELLAAVKSGIWKIEANEVILYHTKCEHKPFDWVPEVYKQRLALGKDGKGLVLKLGINSLYGKSAQSVGKARFANWVWAGNITSGCRAQILQAMARAPNLDDILSIATDGIVSRTRLDLENPIDTNTGTEKPLGGWESKPAKGGRLFVRPGLNSAWPPVDSESDDTRARGIGRKVFTQAIWQISEAIERKAEEYRIKDIQRFVGIKTSLHANRFARMLLPLLRNAPYFRVLLKPEHFSERLECGEWILTEQVISFNPRPKRDQGPYNTLLVRDMNGAVSRPYKLKQTTPENEAYRKSQDIEEEQPG